MQFDWLYNRPSYSQSGPRILVNGKFENKRKLILAVQDAFFLLFISIYNDFCVNNILETRNETVMKTTALSPVFYVENVKI